MTSPDLEYLSTDGLTAVAGGLVRESDLALSTVRKIETNRIQEPEVFTVLALMHALDVSISQLQNVVLSHLSNEEETAGET